MKKNYNLDDLENFLSDSAEQHRMYPSDKVWRNIDQELHGRKSWPALTFGAVLTGAVIIAGLILVHPDKNLLTPTLPSQHSESVNSVRSAETNVSSGSSVHSPGESAKVKSSENDLIHAISTPFYSEVITPASGTKSVVSPIISDDEIAEVLPTKKYQQASINPDAIHAAQRDGIEITQPSEELARKTFGSLEPVNDLSQRLDVESSYEATSPALLFPNTSKDLNLPGLKVNESAIRTIDRAEPKIGTANSSGAKKDRWSLIFYATPSISYRYLSEAKIVDLHLQNNNGPLAPNLTHGVSDFVNHKPMTGFEIGAGIMYNVTPNVRIKSGLQFNLRGYRIQAFAAKRETSTILLNRGYYTDSLTSISTIGTQDGYMAKDISNRYFEIAVPIGLDMKVVDWKKIQLYVAAGIQPTYQFNNSMYMITNDYKKYVQEPDIARHWNVNSSLEAFISYKAAGLTWQAGPQIRYQLLPGAINQYPVRERLIDYGLKIGGC